MTISVVIPAFNEEQYLQACLDSLKSQSRTADEIIVVDNNSTDATAAIARRNGNTVIREDEQGIMPAVYAGFNASTGDIIARCDADSILPADWLQTIEKTLEDRPDAAAVTGPGVFYGTNRLAAAAAQAWYMYAYFLLVGSAIANWPLFGSNCAFRRTAWLSICSSVHRHDNRIHDDIDISVHLCPGNRILLLTHLKVRVSARSLRPSDLRSRYYKGFRSLFIHYPSKAPWLLWKQRFTGEGDGTKVSP